MINNRPDVNDNEKIIANFVNLLYNDCEKMILGVGKDERDIWMREPNLN